MQGTFDINKYYGKWYQLACYSSWYSPPASYNTTAMYTPQSNDTLEVVNTTVVNGTQTTAVGSATVMSPGNLRVTFPSQERTRTAQAFGTEAHNSIKGVNYFIHKVWTDHDGVYVYAIVTDPGRTQFYLLSRTPNPSSEDYGILMKYISMNFDAKKVVQTPHY